MLATLALAIAVWLGSRAGRDLDPALFGYLGAVVVTTFALAVRVSAFWRRPASAFYGRARVAAFGDWSRLRVALGSAGRDLAAQRFVAHRSRIRWIGHLMLSLGTLASFAITLPLVFGWLHFEAEGQDVFRPVFAGIPLPSMPLDGLIAWLVFHALTIAGVAVAVGAVLLLGSRLRRGAVGGATSSAHVTPLLLLLAVAATGLALPASREHPTAFFVAARVHEISVVALLVALSSSKLAHVLVRPLQIGARIVRSAVGPRAVCVACGGAFASSEQLEAVAAILAADRAHCPPCRRRLVGGAQAMLVGARFHPELVEARPRRVRKAA